MKKSLAKLIVYFIFLLMSLTGSQVHAQPEAKDHPLVSRFPGSEVLISDVKQFDEFALILGPPVKGKFSKTQSLEGKVTRFKYKNPRDRSTLEILRSYQQALKRAGFEILFICGGKECGDSGTVIDDINIGRWCIDGLDCPEPMRYLAAKLGRPAGDVYVALKVMNNPYSTAGTYLNVVEVKPMEEGLVKVSAAALASDISRMGHAAVYGIYFDTGKAIIKPESKPVINEIAKLLNSQATLKLHVVGHTDNVGGLASNMTLSKQRAEAVVNALVNDHRIAAARLIANGVGPLAPVASNAAEDGRAKNRRVELVAQ
ncbi:MAG: DUF4892 domain-containing protein [Deltaproteobacteria bacterium]|nr:DUF4892 domain-containing protein [Deltaproteobacteria bacterium]